MRHLALAVLCLLGGGHVALAQLATPRVGCFPLTVQFTAPDDGAVVWDFGDGASSSLRDPSHIYTAAGGFEVVARRSVGGEVLARATVTVYAPPSLNLAVDSATGCAPHGVNFAAEVALPDGITAEGFRWAFGDGAADSGRAVRHVYTRTGAFDVSVRLETDLTTCNVTEVFPAAVTVGGGPTAAFSTDPSPAQSCDAPLVVSVLDESTGEGLAYAWDFGDGRTSTAPDPGANVYGAPGAYTIRLDLTDGDGCTASATAPVSVGGPNPDVDLPDTVCLGATYTVSPRGAADEYAYTYGPGITLVEDRGATQVVTFDAPGATTLSLAVVNRAGDCRADTTRQLFVQEVAVAAVADPAASCTAPFDLGLRVDAPAGVATWRLEPDTSTTLIFASRDTTITIEADDGGEYGYNERRPIPTLVTVTTPQGCTGDTLLPLVVDVPNALMLPDRHDGCAPLTVTFADSVRATQEIAAYVLAWGDGRVDTLDAPGPWAHTYETPGEYTARLTVETVDGCTDTSWGVEIEVGAPVGDLSFEVDDSGLCFGDTLTFVNTTADARVDNVKFRVEGGNDFHCGSADELRHVLTRPIEGDELDATLYVEYNGCLDSLSQNLPYAPAAYAEIGYAIDCDTAFDVTLYNRSRNADTDSVFVSGVSDSTFRERFLLTDLDSLELTLPERGAYRAVLWSENAASACAPDTDTVEFYITLPEARFTLPERLCSGLPLLLDATASQDVNAACSKGYQWDLSWDRPYVTADPILDSMEVTADSRGPSFVELIVEDVNGCRDTTRREIELFATNAEISAVPERLCFPGAVDFALELDADTTVTEVNWDFGGFGTSTERNPTFTFPEVDTVGLDAVTVSVMTVDALGCPGLDLFRIERYEPVSQIGTVPSPAFVCAGSSVDFVAADFTEEGSQLDFSWDFGNGQTGGAQTEAVTYEAGGTYVVRLDFVERASGCRGSTTAEVIVEDVPVPSFTSDIDGEGLVCYPAITTFTDNTTSAAPTTAIWNVGGVPGVGETFTATLPRGETTVRLTSITNLARCLADTSRTFTTVGPVGAFAFEPGVICAGTEVTFTLTDTVDVGSFTWDFGNGETQAGGDPARATYDFIPPGDSTVVSLALESQATECTFTQTEVLRFTRVVADFTTDTGRDTACQSAVQLFDQSLNASTLRFTFPDGSTSGSPSPDFDFGGPGTFDVRLEAATLDGACADDTVKAITVLEPLALTLEADVPVCPGEATTLTLGAARPLADVEFDPAGLIATLDGDVATTIPLTAGASVTVLALDSLGCEGAVVDFGLPLSPVFTGRGDTLVIFAGQEATLAVPGAEGFGLQWADPAATGCEGCPAPTVRPEATRDYFLEVVDPGGCAPQTIVFRVIVAEEPIVPNLFSPNGDGTNDTWRPLYPEGLTPTVEAYQVFSRWGSLVFESADPEAAWTGDNDGSGEAPSDVYTYVVRLSFPGGAEFSDSGEVTLLR